ncbi:hypothetical protein DS837_23275 [Azospirillum brasilense]|uniref:Uncharacterized protein n=2 Tax=Azospirillum brasilense TaxID=192 RepID=A0A6L3AUS0_AZOBR|nr:hypothetical protein DS837_23275 [Azospirillum brasilense]
MCVKHEKPRHEIRRAILDALGGRLPTAVCRRHCCGGLRNRSATDANLVLNLHFFEAGIFEAVRAHLLSNRRTVQLGCDAVVHLQMA